ncbi:MAG: DNA mismatch repair endonuclease MutL [Nitrospirae bacterium]|nr:DNA mismatch repair endonuclease MutL [Nitrospirota bacterium]
MPLPSLVEPQSPPPTSTGRIRLLPDALINRIAAGEVIERPASVVKELLENALDAGATRVDVALGSRELWSITVSDDGEGMSPDDLAIAFQRHATSKITDLTDFDHLATLGFRGEALPSIASVSRVRAVSARHGAAEGAEVRLDGGRLDRIAPCAARPGTTIDVTDLFVHTPARKKFLKSASTELSHICSVLQQHALARPDVAFTVRYDGRAVIEYPPAATPAERLAQVYGRELVDERLIPVRLRRGNVEVTGWCSEPDLARATRRGQEWFVNGRPVRHPLFLRAVDQAYATRLMTGRHPLAVVFVRVPPSEVDVNVHPAKREVRFARPDDVSRALAEALGEAVSRSEIGRVTPVVPPAPVGDDAVREAPPAYVGVRPSERHEAVALPIGPTIRFLGQFDRTFLLAEVDGELRIIDQHAAHERVLYERMLADYTAARRESQPLLVPETCEYPPDQACAIAERLDLLRDVGVEIEPFGSGSFVIRSVPASLVHADWRALVWAMVDTLIADDAMESPEPPHRLLATLACHAAVKAHQRLEAETMSALLRDVVATPRNATCPHGRPVALTWTLYDLERAFGRRG